MHEGQQARNSCPELPIFFSSLAITWYFLHEYCTTQIWCLGGGATLSPSISRVPSFPPLSFTSPLSFGPALSLCVCVQVWRTVEEGSKRGSQEIHFHGNRSGVIVFHHVQHFCPGLLVSLQPYVHITNTVVNPDMFDADESVWFRGLL